MGGCIRTTVLGTSATTQNFWELVTTWQALGVTAGQPVTAVKADYQYRWDFGIQFDQANTIQLGVNQSGPLGVKDGC